MQRAKDNVFNYPLRIWILCITVVLVKKWIGNEVHLWNTDIAKGEVGPWGTCPRKFQVPTTKIKKKIIPSKQKFFNSLVTLHGSVMHLNVSCNTSKCYFTLGCYNPSQNTQHKHICLTRFSTKKTLVPPNEKVLSTPLLWNKIALLNAKFIESSWYTPPRSRIHS